jgi:hypothetical protein
MDEVPMLISQEMAKKVFRVLLLMILCLVLVSPFAHLASALPEPLNEILSVLDKNGKSPIPKLLDLDSESSISTWFSSSTLLFCAVLLTVIASHHGQEDTRYGRRWKILAVIFLFMSLDEATSLHGLMSRLLSDLDVGGLLYYAWVIPGAALVLVFAIAYLRFFLDLPSKSRRLFVIAGVLYIGGALGMEMISGYQADVFGRATPIYVVMTTVEETSEMLGASIFAYALMSYLASLKGSVEPENKGIDPAGTSPITALPGADESTMNRPS